jgi:hypothetical protein
VFKGSWAFPAISGAGGMTTLTLECGSTRHGFEFVGDYSHSNFSITPLLLGLRRKDFRVDIVELGIAVGMF